MKYIYQTALSVALIATLASCAEEEFKFTVDKPLSVELQEQIDAYDALKSYIGDGIALGAGVDLSTYADKGVQYRLINNNFTEIALASGVHHADIVGSNGSLAVEDVVDFLALASEAGLSTYGSALTTHTNQNAEFLNSTIAPVVIPPTGGPLWEVITSADFETDDNSNYLGNENAQLAFTADGEGANGEGRALKVTNSTVRENDWQSQIFLSFDPITQVGEVWKLTMDIRADEAATYATQAQTQPFAYKHWNFFGAFNATTEWTTVEVEITITAETSECGAIAFNLGNTATSYYFDNIELARFNESGGGAPTWDLLTGVDFETDDNSNYLANENAQLAFTASGDGANGTGRAMTVTNAQVRDNDWQSQFFVTFDRVTEEGDQYELTMDVRADVAASYGTQAHVVPYEYKHWNFFGTVNATPDWTTYTTRVNINAETSGCTAIAFNLGNTATTYYFDNIEVRWLNEDGGGEQIIEKTPEEKKDTLSIEMEKWISGIMEVSKEHIKAWDVVKNPLDDANPSEVQTSEGKELGENDFYWQDYLGKDYAVLAFNLARQYGNDGDLLFISESNLESNLDKCQGLIDYVAYIEDQGAAVDGIATQMHLNLDTDKASIDEMFKLLAATGKRIKVSELNVAMGDNPTLEMLDAQSDLYKYVVEVYTREVPAAQRYGITVWGPTDGADRQGLWNSKLTRKPAYAGFADGLNAID